MLTSPVQDLKAEIAAASFRFPLQPFYVNERAGKFIRKGAAQT